MMFAALPVIVRLPPTVATKLMTAGVQVEGVGRG